MPEPTCARHHRRLLQDVDRSFFCPQCVLEGIESSSYDGQEIRDDEPHSLGEHNG